MNNENEMARIVRNTEGLADTPIIMLTSVDQSLANTSYRDLGIDAQLIKPAEFGFVSGLYHLH